MAGFGKKGVSNGSGSGRIDRYRPVETGLMPERDAPRFFYHDKSKSFWAFVIMIAALPIGYYIYAGTPLTGSWTGAAGFVSFGIFMAFFLRRTGQFDDKPESDLRGFFLGGPWFLGGAAVGAAGFVWFEGVSWIWSYDLTDIKSLNGGIQSLRDVKELDGLAGFLDKLGSFLGLSLASGAVVKQIAVKIGIDEAFSTSSDGQTTGRIE